MKKTFKDRLSNIICVSYGYTNHVVSTFEEDKRQSASVGLTIIKRVYTKLIKDGRTNEEIVQAYMKTSEGAGRNRAYNIYKLNEFVGYDLSYVCFFDEWLDAVFLDVVASALYDMDKRSWIAKRGLEVAEAEYAELMMVRELSIDEYQDMFEATAKWNRGNPMSKNQWLGRNYAKKLEEQKAA